MKSIKKQLTVCLFFLIGFSAMSQTEQLFLLNYSTAQPLGSLNDLTSKFSTRGFDFDLKFFMNENVAVGVSVGWNSFYEKNNRSTYEIEADDYNGAITAAQWNFAYIAPIMLVGTYVFFDDTYSIRPFAQFGIGTSYVEEAKVAGSYVSYKSSWSPTISPAVGVSYQVEDASVGFNFKATYNQTYFKGNLMTNPSYLAYSFGLTFYQ